MRVAEVMSTPVVTARADELVAAAAARMRDQGVGSVVVVDGERAIGILTERDLVRFAGSTATDGDQAPEITGTVGEWMTADPNCVGPDVDATAAFASLAEHGYRHIPVVDDDRLVGIVSMRDVMRVAQIQPAAKASTTTASTARSSSPSAGPSKTSGTSCSRAGCHPSPNGPRSRVRSRR
jgi:CBS domain-containing protein